MKRKVLSIHSIDIDINQNYLKINSYILLHFRHITLAYPTQAFNRESILIIIKDGIYSGLVYFCHIHADLIALYSDSRESAVS